MRYLRFILAPVVLSLAFAYLLPSAGVTITGGVTGVLFTVGLGAGYAALFALHRYVEHWLVGRFARDSVQAHNLCQLSVLAAMAVAGLLLYGVAWLLPSYLDLAGWGSVVLSAFWLGVIGLSLSPAPALVRSHFRPETPDAREPVGTDSSDATKAPDTTSEQSGDAGGRTGDAGGPSQPQ